MPFSFIEIEERKKRVIIFLFLGIILFYFFGAYILTITLRAIFTLSRVTSWKNIFLLPLGHLVAILSFAFIVGILHWFMSVSGGAEKILRVLRAYPPDKEDTYHRRLTHIVEEVSIATGGRKIDCMVLPLSCMNAFSLDDFRNHAVIGVTEGLLSRLNRPQLEAVVAHEAAHIVSKDTLIKTVAVSLFSIYGAIMEHLKKSMSGSARYSYSKRGGAPPAVIVVYVVCAILYGLSKCMSMFISRQCEYRADAIAIRLVRYPLSLAQALYRISRGWRGGGIGYDTFESLFIINPNYSYMDEREGFFANLFSTHPPTQKRIDILLNMGHSDFETLENTTKKVKRKRHTEVAPTPFKAQRWFITKGDQWEGPFLATDLITMGVLRHDSFVRREGTQNVTFTYQDPQLLAFLRNPQAAPGGYLCPRCYQPLSKVLYEGAPVYQCNSCRGALVGGEKISRILIREEQGFSEEVIRQAHLVEEAAKKVFFTGKTKMICELSCPKCKGKMIRNLYSLVYPIEVDRCYQCALTWFDKNELEMLQYLIEKAKE